MEINSEKATLKSMLKPSQESQEADSAKPLEARWVAHLFAHFQVRYGNRWTSILPTEEFVQLALIEWGRELAGITPEQIKLALTKLSPEWPPTPGEFKAYCSSKPAAPYHRTAPRLTRPASDPEIRRKAIQAMRERRVMD